MTTSRNDPTRNEFADMMTSTNKRDGGEVEFWAERLEMLASSEGCGAGTMQHSALLLREQERALAESRAELGRVIRERDETFQLMLDRATKAEARAERLAALLHEAWGHVPSGTLADQIHVALEQEPQE